MATGIKPSCSERIQEFEKKIFEIEREIVTINEQFGRAELSEDDLQYLRQKESQLREEKRQLREEKMLLLQERTKFEEEPPSKRLKLDGHTSEPMSECENTTPEALKDRGAEQTTIVTTPTPPICTVHNKQMTTYCFDCVHLFCEDCIATNHAGHKSEPTIVAAPETKKLLAEHLAPLRETQASLCNAAEAVQVVKSEVVAQGTTITENVEHSFQELEDIIEQHKLRLLVEATEKVEDKVTKLTTQEKQVNTASAVIQSLVDFVEQNLENATDEELMMIHKQVLSRIDKEAEDHRKGAIDLDPVEIADMKLEVSCAKKINQGCHTGAQLHQLADPSKCTVEEVNVPPQGVTCTLEILRSKPVCTLPGYGKGPGLNSTEVNQQSHIIVRTLLHNGAPTKKPQTVTAELKSVVNGSVIRLEGVQKEGNTYEIQFTPAVRGRHHLTLRQNWNFLL